MKEPVDHIIRPALPWRTGGATITEGGLDAAHAMGRKFWVSRSTIDLVLAGETRSHVR